MFTRSRKIVALGAALALLTLPAVALAGASAAPIVVAQGYGPPPPGVRSIRGTIVSAAPYHLVLRNGVQIVMHNGTIINPTGTTLVPGMHVRVFGHWRHDGAFEANRIQVI